ncbi:MAG: bacillithiol biosynthesis cysteine-adding enzyme BshC [Saprospiraceae bacterium]
MISNVTSRNFKEIPQFSAKDIMYQTGDDAYNGFYKYSAHIESFQEAIAQRKNHDVDRRLLADVLLQQYSKNNPSKNIISKIKSLENSNTFTITTAHQPVLLLGPLYMVYKILSTISLCNSLKKHYPEYNFVPIFVSGGEDHDLDEVATMHIFNKDITWHSNQTGSVGRMKLDGIEKVIDQVSGLFGQTPFATELSNIIKQSFSAANSYGEFNTNLYKSLFSDLGLIVLNMDDEKLKERFLPYAIKEIEDKISHKEVTSTQEKLAEKGIKAQAHVRDINLFYLTKGSRERIIEIDKNYAIGDQKYSKEELINLLKQNPGAVSPNVVMRPIYQEIILPNLAYVGGGGEIAYWLERKSQFEKFNVSYPILVRRNSALIVASGVQKQMNKLGLEVSAYFKSQHDLTKYYLSQNTESDYSLSQESGELQSFFNDLARKVKIVDPSLEKYTLAEGAKQLKVLKNISGRMTKAAKVKNEIHLKKLENIKLRLFPLGTMQERYDNFIPYYLKYGKEWLGVLLEHLDPLNKDFLILEE